MQLYMYYYYAYINDNIITTAILFTDYAIHVCIILLLLLILLLP
jgi:hypothetical protein